MAGLLEADLEAVADFFMVDGDSENLFGTVVYFQGEIFLVRNDWRTVKSNLYEEFQDEVFCGRGDTKLLNAGRCVFNRLPQYIRTCPRSDLDWGDATSSGHSNYSTPHTHNFLKEEFKHDTYILWPMLASHTGSAIIITVCITFFYEYSPVQRERRSPSNV